MYAAKGSVWEGFNQVNTDELVDYQAGPHPWRVILN
jgi:hypothetical protein